jgi:hypothetical protein
MGDTEDFLAAISLALLLGVSIAVILKIIEELLKSNKSIELDLVKNKLKAKGYEV